MRGGKCLSSYSTIKKNSTKSTILQVPYASVHPILAQISICDGIVGYLKTAQY